MINIDSAILKCVTFSALIIASMSSVTLQESRYITSKIVLSLQRTVLFYKRNYDQLNLDGVFGFRIAESIIANLLIRKNHLSDFSDIYLSSKDMFTILQKVNVLAVKKMESENSAYFKLFEKLFRNFWFFQAPSKPFNKELVQPIYVNEDEFDEEKSDHCMSNILGSQKSGIEQKCIITEECWKAVTQKGTGGYYLTHQILYFIIAEIIGCRSVISDHLNFDVNKLYVDLGSNVYSQMKKNFEQDFTDQDLFLEQGMVCNWMGITSCNQMKWIEEIINWQDEGGCVKLQDDIEDLRPADHVGPARKLHVDVVLKDGCSAHTTGLYIAYLAFTLHFILTSNEVYSRKTLWNINENMGLIIILFIFIVVFIRYFNKKWILRCRTSILHNV